ncbi:MAG TPA: WYL domain-containing protein, partial [Chitinophagaceae bacterium]
IPVSFEQHKGYFIVQGYFLPPVSFTNDEANALLLMEAIVTGFADKSIQKHYSTALSKVKSVLRSSQKEKIEQLNNNIRLQVPSCYVHNYEYLSIIQTAIASKNILEIGYMNNNNIASSRQLEPIGLIFYALNWHLIGYCHHRHDYRDFRVGRILRLSNTGLPFRKTDHIELNEYMKTLPVNY